MSPSPSPPPVVIPISPNPVLGYVQSTILDPTGTPIVGAQVQFIPSIIRGKSGGIVVSGIPVMAITDANGVLISLGLTDRASIYGGNYDVRINNIDFFKITVPNDGEVHELTDIIL